MAKVKNYKVLLFGYNQTNFLLPIYKFIKQNSSSPFDFYAYNLKSLGNTQDENYIKKVDGKFRYAPLGILISIAYALSSSSFFFELKNYGSLKIKFKGWLQKWLFQYNYSKNFKNYDIIHIHFCHPYYMQFVAELPHDIKLICSVWGSDILKQQNPNAIRIQQLAFERADIITIQTVEMSEILLDKYGHHLKEKIHIVQFGIPHHVFELIKNYYNNKPALSKLIDKLGMSTEKIRIVIGSNRSENNNHILIVKSILLLPKNYLNKVQLIFPFGYGNIDVKYKQQINNLLNSQNVDALFLNEFLIGDKLAGLRLSAHIYIHLPKTDALSATLAEYLYSGTTCIVGKWLPYTYFKERAFEEQLIEINNINELSTILVNLFEKKHTYKFNINAALESSSETVTSPKWYQLYYNLINV